MDTPEQGQVCTGTWFVDGEEVASAPLTLGEGPATFTYRYDYYYGMPESSTITYRLTYTTQDGREQAVSGENTLTLENFRTTASPTPPSPSGPPAPAGGTGPDGHR